MLQGLAGAEDGAKEAALEVALVQEPAQLAVHWYDREFPSASEAVAETDVDCPAARRLREAETLDTTGQRLNEILGVAAPLVVPETTVTERETETAIPWESVTVKVIVWAPEEEGAVQEVVVAAGAENVPLEAVHA